MLSREAADENKGIRGKLGGAHRRVSHVFCSQGVKHCTSGMLQWEKPTKAAYGILFLEQTEVLGSPQTVRLSLHLLVSNPTAPQRAQGYLGTWPSPFPVQSREVRKAQESCLPSWLHQAAAWDCRSRLSGASCKKKMQFPQISTVLLSFLGGSWAV